MKKFNLKELLKKNPQIDANALKKRKHRTDAAPPRGVIARPFGRRLDIPSGRAWSTAEPAERPHFRILTGV